MEDIPDNEDSEPRTVARKLIGAINILTINPLLLVIPGSAADIISILLLLVVALFCSALRASLSASAALEMPWEKKTPDRISDRQGRFALLLIQHTCMLLAWLITANLLISELEDSRTMLYSFLAVVSLWLVADAVLRWYAGHYAASIPEKSLPVINAVLDFLNPIGGFFLKIAVFLGISKKEGRESESDVPDKEDADAIEEKELLLGVAAMGKTTAREAMVSKSNIRAFSIELDFHELMDMVNKSGYSRIPVYRHNLDSIEGILYIKDLLPHIQQNEKFAWQKLIRKAYLIPETKRLDSLLEEFQERRVHMAIVMDEYGTTRGLITLEDIIEEIFGDINDEHDDENETHFVQLDDNNYIFEGQALLNDVIRALDLDPDYFADLRIESETLAGLILELFTRVPRHGEEVVFKDLTFKIQAATKKQIRKVRVTLPPFHF